MKKKKLKKYIVYEYQADIIVETWRDVRYGTDYGTKYRTERQWVEGAECVEGKSDEEIERLIKLREQVIEWGTNEKKCRNVRVEYHIDPFEEVEKQLS